MRINELHTKRPTGVEPASRAWEPNNFLYQVVSRYIWCIGVIYYTLYSMYITLYQILSTVII